MKFEYIGAKYKCSTSLYKIISLVENISSKMINAHGSLSYRSCYDSTRHFLDCRKMTVLTNFEHNFRTVKKLRRKIDQIPYILVLSLRASVKTTIKELKTIRKEFDMKSQNKEKMVKKYRTPPLLFFMKNLKI